MKTSKMIYIAAIFFLPVLLYGQQQNQTSGRHTAIDEFKNGIDRDIKSRKIDIKPIQQEVGIKTGLIVAYGHIIPPPYKVYAEKGKLMINGVQVSPSLVWEREVPKFLHKDVTVAERLNRNRASEVIGIATRMFCDKKRVQPYDELLNHVLTYVLQSTDVVVSAKWFMGKQLPLGTIEVKWVNDAGPNAINFSEGSCPDSSVNSRHQQGNNGNIVQQEQKNLERYAEGVEKGLKKGVTVVFASHGEARIGHDIRTEINEIMLDKNLSDTEKAERIKDRKIGYKYSVALDIIENFNQAEWAVKK